MGKICYGEVLNQNRSWVVYWTDWATGKGAGSCWERDRSECHIYSL